MRLRMSSYLLGGIIVATLGYMLTNSPEMSAQSAGSKGDKAVYFGTTVSTIHGSTAYVDATAWQGTSNDICHIINQALVNGSFPTAGVVIDARGIQNTAGGGAFLTCANDTTPWLQKPGSSYVYTRTPAVILLPSANICITTPWIIPDQTRVIGAGEFGPFGTVIWAANGSNPPGCSGIGSNFSDANSSTSPSIIYMGFNGTPKITSTVNYPSAPCPNTTCTDVGVKDIQLVGEAMPTSSGLIGINNSASQPLSYIDQVEFSYIPGTGLTSGVPFARYTDLSASPNTSGVAGTLCLALVQPNGNPNGQGVSGVHGFSCTPPAPSTTQVTGMTADGLSINNQDMHFEAATTNGLLIGANDSSQANLVINVTGSQDIAYTTSPSGCTLGAPGCSPTGGVVHLSNAQNDVGGNVDVALLAIASGCDCADGQPTTILDDLTGNYLYDSGLAITVDTDRSVGLYVEGESFNRTPVVVSRFTTSPSWQTWGVGIGAPPTSTNPVCKPGSLYSNTSATYGSGSPNTIYICMKPSPTGAAQWYALK